MANLIFTCQKLFYNITDTNDSYVQLRTTTYKNEIFHQKYYYTRYL